MINLIDTAVDTLKVLKQSELLNHEKRLMDIFSFILPNKSKALSTNFYKKIFSIENELNLVLVSHLYLERVLNEILHKNLNGFETLERKGILNSFYKKIVFLRSERITPDSILNDLLIFNQLRNRYAHELNYNLAEFDIFQFSFLKKHSKSFDIKRKSSKRTLNRILVRHSVFHLIVQLTSNHRYLHLIDEE